MLFIFWKRRLILSLLLGAALNALAAAVLAVMASNFTKPMTETAEALKSAPGHEANLSFGSSGQFVA